MVIMVIFILFTSPGFEKILDDIVKIRFNFRVRNCGFFSFLNNSLCLEKSFYYNYLGICLEIVDHPVAPSFCMFIVYLFCFAH